MERISEGAEALIYAETYMGLPVVVKDRISKRYREPLLDSRIRTQRTRSEAKITALASSNGASVPKILHMSGTWLYIGRINGDTLNTVVPTATLMREAGRQLAILHGIDIAHGDYTPANLMVDGKNALWVIDFGLSEITSSPESKALDVLLMKRSVGGAAYRDFLEGYRAGNKESGKILEKLAGIEKRGRYQSRTLARITAGKSG